MKCDSTRFGIFLVPISGMGKVLKNVFMVVLHDTSAQLVAASLSYFEIYLRVLFKVITSLFIILRAFNYYGFMI